MLKRAVVAAAGAVSKGSKPKAAGKSGVVAKKAATGSSSVECACRSERVGVSQTRCISVHLRQTFSVSIEALLYSGCRPTKAIR